MNTVYETEMEKMCYHVALEDGTDMTRNQDCAVTAVPVYFRK